MPPDTMERWLTLVTLASAALAGLLYISRQIWRGFRLMERLSEVVQHELSPNTGSSMKDDVAAIAVAVGTLQAELADLRTSKDLAHELLQLQLTSLHDDLGNTPGLHKAATHKRERQASELQSDTTRPQQGKDQ